VTGRDHEADLGPGGNRPGPIGYLSAMERVKPPVRSPEGAQTGFRVESLDLSSVRHLH
jgi:hypothetical protein